MDEKEIEMTVIIGIAGKAGSGKDTVGKMLVEHYGFKRLAFADRIKDTLHDLGIAEPSRDAKESLIFGRTFSYRQAMHTLGDGFRAMDPNFWIQQVTAQVGLYPRVVVTDVRFDHEALTLKSLGGIIFEMRGRQADMNGLERHVTEQGLKCVIPDASFWNRGTLDELREALDRRMQSLKWSNETP